MISLFFKLMDQQVDGQFRKDPGGRLVFLPLGRKAKAYFVDSKSDEEKIRSLVKMYRSASALISLLFPTAYLPVLILNSHAEAILLRNKFGTFAGLGLFFILVPLGLQWMAWSVYKDAVPGLTASLSEVGPDLKGQLSDAYPPPRLQRRIAMVGLVAVIIALGGMILTTRHYSRGRVPCPAKSTSTSPVFPVNPTMEILVSMEPQ
jgi:hypothetical protein